MRIIGRERQVEEKKSSVEGWQKRKGEKKKL